MYELWLALNIVWETALGIGPMLVVAAAVWLGLVVMALRGSSAWRGTLPLSLALGLAVAIAAFLTVPSLTRSSLGELRYWVDWANLAAIALAAGGMAAAFAWPVLARWRAAAA
jgi:hypothetical protein